MDPLLLTPEQDMRRIRTAEWGNRCVWGFSGELTEGLLGLTEKREENDLVAFLARLQH